MTNYVITTDSGCDLSFDFCKEIGVVPILMKYSIDDVEYTDDMNFASLEVFFDKMRGGAMPRTAQLNEVDFLEFWEPFIKEGKDIIHICMSSGISGTYSNGKRTADELCEKYPDRKVTIVDTLMTSTGNGLILIEAARLQKEGASYQECLAWTVANYKRVRACFTTDDITYLHRGGRVSKTGMILSKALHIYPVLHVDGEGHLKAFAKTRGSKAAWETVSKYIAEYCENPKEQVLYVSDAANETGARALGEMLVNRFGFKNVYYSKIGSIIGAHTGPALLTVFFLGKER